MADGRGLRLEAATQTHVQDLVAHVRPEDNEEWVAASGRATRRTLAESVQRCTLPPARAAVLEDRTLAIWGVSPSDYDVLGYAWFIGAAGVERHALAMHRFFRAGIAEMHSRFPVLHALAYSRNTLHHTWMLRMGFRDTGIVERVGLGFDFMLFERTQ